MTTARRRSPRVIAQIPVSLRHGGGARVHALTAVVNRQGALLLSSVGFDEGTVLHIHNELIPSSAPRCRVVWVGEPDLTGAHKLGVEFMDDASMFWGNPYEEQLLRVSGAEQTG